MMGFFSTLPTVLTTISTESFEKSTRRREHTVIPQVVVKVVAWRQGMIEMDSLSALL
jgi:hypothetical protein